MGMGGLVTDKDFRIIVARSAQPCGCDLDAGWTCERHQETEKYQEAQKPINNLPGTISYKSVQTIPQFSIKDSGKRQDFASGSVRDTAEGKIKWSRITFGPMMRRWAEHLTKAEAKYPDPTPGVPNFTLIETEEERIRYRESALRHFWSWWYGETDEDHAAATFFNINGVEIIDNKRRGIQP
jgi:hypothetical protein